MADNSYEVFDPKKIKTDVYISGGTASNTKKYQGTSLVNLYSNDITIPNQNTLLEQFDNFAPDYRKSLSQKLKAAGYYRGDITGKPSLKLQEAYFKAYEDLDFYNRQRLTTYAGDPSQAYNVQLDNIESFLLKQDTGDGTGTGPRIPDVDRVISTPLQGRTIINKVFEDLVGRGATKAEFDKYYTQIVARQKAKPVVTKYSKGATSERTRTGGPDVEEFLFQKIAGTDEAKSRKVFGFYDIFKQALGVD